MGVVGVGSAHQGNHRVGQHRQLALAGEGEQSAAEAGFVADISWVVLHIRECPAVAGLTPAVDRSPIGEGGGASAVWPRAATRKALDRFGLRGDRDVPVASR
ncbi:hypothetical protein GCM10022140_26830 [Rhodococcus aetherivorans]